MGDFLKKRSDVSSFPSMSKELLELPETLTVYTDGGYQAFCDVGAWAFVAVNTHGDPVAQDVGGMFETTNNRMEMRAALQALSVLEIGRPIILFSDSEYLIKGLRWWVNNWSRNGWVTGEGKPVKNRDLWERLHALRDLHTIAFEHVYGHMGDQWNEHVDKLCTAHMKELRLKKKFGGRAPVDAGSV